MVRLMLGFFLLFFYFLYDFGIQRVKLTFHNKASLFQLFLHAGTFDQ